MAKYRPHGHIKDKQRRLAGWRVSRSEDMNVGNVADYLSPHFQAALNNPNTTKEARAHARKELLLRFHIKDAFFSTSMNTRIRRAFGLQAKRKR